MLYLMHATMAYEEEEEDMEPAAAALLCVLPLKSWILTGGKT